MGGASCHDIVVSEAHHTIKRDKLNCSGAHVQHPRCITNAAGIQGHINDLSLDLRRLPGVGILEEKRASVIRARPAPIPLLALPCRAMSHNIRALTVRTVEDFDHHDATLSRWGFSASAPLDRIADQHLWNTF